MSRRSAAILAGVALIAVVGVAAVALAVTRLGNQTPTAALGSPTFVDETVSAGLDHRYDGPFAFAVGGGVAAFDCDDDGKPELYLAGGAEPAALYRNESPIGGALRFSRLADPVTDLESVNGAYPLDVDGDGRTDLVVLRNGESLLLRGLGDCRFERANEALGFDGLDGQTEAFSATWEGSAGLPTLAFGRYLKLDTAGEPTLECDTNSLVRPGEDGSRYAAPIVLEPGYCALSMLFSDWDRSGRRDLRVSNDRHYYDFVNGQEQLWRVAPGEAPRLYSDADGWVQLQIQGMGIASDDLTGDGYPELYLTSQGPNRLQTLTSGPAQPTYREIGTRRGISAGNPFAGGDPLPSTAWHPEFQDVNNDGFIDLFVSKGNVDQEADYAKKDPSNLLLGGPDLTFREAADQAGILNYDKGRGAALADFNLDGLPDLVEVNYGAGTRLWRNVGGGTAEGPVAMGHWLGVRLAQPGPNRDAIGSWLEVKVGDATQRRELTVGGGHAGGELGWLHFGLGPADHVDLRVQWPDGEWGPWLRAAGDQFVIVDRASGTVQPWTPR
jgi:hypothetical protein